MITTADTERLYLNQDSLWLDIGEYWDDEFSSLPLQEFKYARWDKAVDVMVPDSVKPLLMQMLDIVSVVTENCPDYRWFVDYKVRDLKAGDCGCPLEGWHMDVVRNPNHNSRKDVHVIYSTEVGTEFSTAPLFVEPDDTDFQQVLDRCSKDWFEWGVVSAKPNHMSVYTRHQLHRGPVVKKDCRRLLVRVTATDVIGGVNG